MRRAASERIGMAGSVEEEGSNRIRNFALLAHIDHGKSTFADRVIQMTGALSAREMRAQVLDSMEIERERGITVKAQTVSLEYQARDGKRYQLNMMDTPGHVDFSYEVGRSLAACEGALLLVDATQGVEAQTLAHAYSALEADLEILPILNKIDLPAADIPKIKAQIEEVLGLESSNLLAVSAKTGEGVDEVMERLITAFPPPRGKADKPLKALIVDSWYDSYLGVVVLVRIMEGVLKKGDSLLMMASGEKTRAEAVGVFRPKRQEVPELRAGQIGYLTGGIKEIAAARVGDTITHGQKPASQALEGFHAQKPVLYCGLFAAERDRFEDLRDALQKLQLNDSGLTFTPERSPVLGAGFRCGFLGLLHMEIVVARMEREFGLDLITTAPSVVYHIYDHEGRQIAIHSPSEMPQSSKIARIEEPWIRATLLLPEDYLGAVLALCQERRGRQHDLNCRLGRAHLIYDLPLNETIFDFHDRLKSASRGYASFDYRHEDYHEGDLAHLSILVNGESVEALDQIVHRSHATTRGRAICEKLKEEIPRHLFKIPLQAAVGSRIVARETIPALRKDVTAKCYGGDISRKRKLLDKQKKGKKKMRQLGRVEVPQSAFLSVLKGE